MRLTRRKFLIAGGAAALSATARAQARDPQDPQPRPNGATPGRARPLGLGDRDRDGLLYLPSSYRKGVAMPLVVVLHGAGNTSLSVQGTFQHAETLGFIVLAPDSRDERSWDGVLGIWGPDLEFIGEALKYAQGQCAINQDHIGLAGFSDGASYALSMGIGNGDLFTRIMAFSPGIMQPAAVRGKPRVFISHGIGDPVMPIDITSRKFVPRLRNLGYDVTYREFDGRHTLPPAIAREAYEWFSR